MPVMSLKSKTKVTLKHEMSAVDPLSCAEMQMKKLEST